MVLGQAITEHMDKLEARHFLEKVLEEGIWL